MAYNRELSQLAPFIYVDEYLRNIGIGSTNFPHVGMGTTVPIGKLDVRGHSHFTNVAVSTGATIANLRCTGVTTTFNFEATGISSFVGFSTFRDNIIVTVFQLLQDWSRHLMMSMLEGIYMLMITSMHRIKN